MAKQHKIHLSKGNLATLEELLATPSWAEGPEAVKNLHAAGAIMTKIMDARGQRPKVKDHKNPTAKEITTVEAWGKQTTELSLSEVERDTAKFCIRTAAEAGHLGAHPDLNSLLDEFGLI